MKRKVISSLLAVSLMFGLCACGGGASDGGSSAGDSGEASSDDGSYAQVTYAYSTFNNIPTEETLDTIEEEINKITREKIHAEITLKPIGIADYSSNVSLALQAGEKIDVFESLGDFNNCVATGMAADITDLIDSCAAEAKEVVGDEWLEACTKDGKIYGIPTMKPIALTPMLIYRADIAKELGLDMESVNTYEDITAVLAAVKEAYPDMIPMAPVEPGNLGLNRSYGDIDYLSDDYNAPVGVLLDGEMNVVDLYSSDIFASRCNLAREWYNQGLVMKDAATTTSMAAELMSSGNYFCYSASYSYPEEDTAAALAAQTGNFEIGAKMLDDAYLSTAEVNAITWMIASNSDVTEAALKFLNLTFTDEDIVNLLIYGIKDRDYVLDDEGYMSYPEGQDATTVPYTAQLSCGTLGNYFIMYPMVGTSKESLEWELEQNQSADVSPAMGFSFDATAFRTQYTAVNNVINQYLPGLMCGSVDPETEIPKFVSALNDAGYQDILAAKQEQLDAWKAAN
ncbi:MAG: ABC transporter substrate-binding protein [Lachnospiraceae bacterium]|nr:ABC transporter substrate-binding protein [Lachnospiraceae bacterium]